MFLVVRSLEIRPSRSTRLASRFSAKTQDEPEKHYFEKFVVYFRVSDDRIVRNLTHCFSGLPSCQNMVAGLRGLAVLPQPAARLDGCTTRASTSAAESPIQFSSKSFNVHVNALSTFLEGVRVYSVRNFVQGVNVTYLSLIHI